jgi:inorganic triphosphatase YgiF
MGKQNREVEAKLVIRSERPREIAREIASLAAVGRFRLVARGTLALRDSYFDTEDGDLRRAGASLRIRAVDGERWITLKGPAERDAESGTVERDETELPWSREALHRVVAALSALGVDLPSGREGAGGDDPVAALRALGLRPVQDRATERRVRDVLAEEGGDPVAELVVDSVRYQLDGREVWHHEVEVEAKGRNGGKVVRAVAAALRERFPDTLRPWTRGKLSTGRVLERLLRSRELEGLLGPDGSLTPAAYDRIDDA